MRSKNREIRKGGPGQSARDLGYVRDLGHRIPTEERREDRGHYDRHHQAKSTEAGLLQDDDEDDRPDPHRHSREIDLVEGWNSRSTAFATLLLYSLEYPVRSPN